MMVHARLAQTRGTGRTPAPPPLLGLITIASAAVMGAFAGVSPSFIGEQRHGRQHAPVGGARSAARSTTVVVHDVTTGRCQAQYQITVTVPAPAPTLSSVVNSAVFDTSVSATTSVGHLQRVRGLAATCGLFSGQIDPRGP